MIVSSLIQRRALRILNAACAYLLWLVTLTATVAADEEFNPYAVPKEQFAARVRTIALMPIDLPSRTHNAAAIAKSFEDLISEGLRTKGYAVVPAAEFEKHWRLNSERLGGTFNTATGIPLKDRFAVARDHTARELARLHRADAILRPFVTLERAPFGRGWFGWTSLGESLMWEGADIGSHLDDCPQAVMGAYLNIVIADLDGAKLYGIQFPIEWTSIYVARGYEDKPPERILADSERNRAAVEQDLEPLVEAASRN